MRDIFELSRTDLAWLEDKFQRYNQLDREIAIRKEELKMKEIDENNGGGRSSFTSNPTETIVLREQSDKYIQTRLLWKNSILKTIEDQSEDIQDLINDKYWGQNNFMDWEPFGKMFGYSKSSIYRIRYKVLECFAEKIGYL